MKTICGWHRMYYPKEKPPVLKPGRGNGESHGMCPRCSKRWLEQFEKSEKRKKAA